MAVCSHLSLPQLTPSALLNNSCPFFKSSSLSFFPRSFGFWIKHLFSEFPKHPASFIHSVTQQIIVKHQLRAHRIPGSRDTVMTKSVTLRHSTLPSCRFLIAHLLYQSPNTSMSCTPWNSHGSTYLTRNNHILIEWKINGLLKFIKVAYNRFYFSSVLVFFFFLG